MHAKERSVEICCNECRKAFTRELFFESNFLGYEVPSNFSGLKSSGLMLVFFVGFMVGGVNGKMNSI